MCGSYNKIHVLALLDYILSKYWYFMQIKDRWNHIINFKYYQSLGQSIDSKSTKITRIKLIENWLARKSREQSYRTISLSKSIQISREANEETRQTIGQTPRKTHANTSKHDCWVLYAKFGFWYVALVQGCRFARPYVQANRHHS